MLKPKHLLQSRITTKFTASPTAKSRRQQKRLKRARPETFATGSAPDGSLSGQPAPTGNLTLKTYDNASHVCLKYRTNKAAEVGRLISALGRLSKGMAGQPMDEPLAPAAAEPDPIGADPTPASEEKAKQQLTASQASGGGGSGGGGKKKKKGKK